MRAARLVAASLALSVATTALLLGPAAGQQTPAAASAPSVPVRSGVHPDYSRLVFDWPQAVPYILDQDGAAVSIRFPLAARIDLAGVLRAKPSRISNLTQTTADGAVTVRFDIPAGAGIKQSRAGARIIVDVLDKAPAGTTPAPAPAAKPVTAATPTAQGSASRPPDPRQAKEGAPLYQLRGNTAPAEKPPEVKPAASEAPVQLVPAPANPPPAVEVRATPLPTEAGPSVAVAPPPPAAETAVGTEPRVPAEATLPPVSLIFDPKAARAAAIFERAGYLYILFDEEVSPTTAPVVPEGLQTQIEPINVPGGAGYRLSIPALMQASIKRDGTAWHLTLARATDAAPASTTSILPRPDPDFALGPRLVAPATDAEEVITFKDPVVGDTLSVVPLALPGQHVEAPLRYTEVQFLPTLQGIVIRPLVDRLAVQPVREGVEVTVPGGLHLSPATDVRAAVPPPPPVVEQEKLFDFKRWGQVPLRDYTKTRQAKWDRLVALPDAEKTRGRLDIARFYVANGMGHEALGMLTRVQSLQPDVDRRPEFLAVRGIGRVLAGDHAGALADLSNRQLTGEPDAALWRAAALAGEGDYTGAHAAFQASKDLLDHYSEPFYTDLALTAADAALRSGQPEAAALTMDKLAKRGGENGDRADAVQYFRGAVFRALGDDEKAMSYFKRAQEGRDRLYAMRGKRDFIDTALAAGKMTPKDAAKKMEELRFAWRGDDYEMSNLRRIGEVYAIAGEFPEAFDTMRHTIAAFPNTPQAKEIAADLTKTFTDLFATDGAARMSPLEAMALYEQYRELTPPGPDGDRIIRKLAERLVEIDLLDRAGQLLDHQVQYRLQGLEKAQVGTRLAGIRLLDGKPQEAIAALDKSTGPDIPDDLAEERRLLRARALSQTNKGTDAVQLLATDQSRTANLLRIDIAMRDKQWKAAATALADVIGSPPPPGTPLDPQVSGLVVNRATALSLAGDNAGLDALRRDFGPAMEKSKDATFFRLLTRPEESAGLADANTIRQRITEIDLFRSFLDQYRTARQEAAAPAPTAPAPTAPPT